MPVRLIPQVAADSAGASGEPWGIAAVGAERCELAGEGVCVAILDTGINAGHPTFAGLIHATNYRDFTGTGLEDRVGHGTHCAGIIFGRTIGGRRIGVAPGITQVLVAKIADRDFITTTEQLEAALIWAVGAGADIISMSIGLDFLGHAKALQAGNVPPDAALVEALNDYRDYSRFFDSLMGRVISAGAARNSALVVAAVGNDSHGEGTSPYRIPATLPAVADDVIAVGAVGRGAGDKLVVAPFSNTAANVCAPGVDILSATRDGGYGTMSGTSQAAPHVAGVAALWWQKVRNETFNRPSPASVRETMLGAAKFGALSPPASVEEIGRGLVMAP
jgi:subtilisin family serine protease